MTTYVGGTRMRLISDSFYNMVLQGLTDRHWFDSGRQHQPIEMVRGEISWDTPIDINTLAVSDVNVNNVDLEMGSNYSQDTWQMYVDFYAESDSLGLDVSGDVRDILRGKIPSINRSRPILPVFDLTQDPVPVDPIFYCAIEGVLLDRAHNKSRPFETYWYSVQCDVVDTYGNEDDAP